MWEDLERSRKVTAKRIEGMLQQFLCFVMYIDYQGLNLSNNYVIQNDKPANTFHIKHILVKQ